MPDRLTRRMNARGEPVRAKTTCCAACARVFSSLVAGVSGWSGFNWTKETTAERFKLQTTFKDLTDLYMVKYIMDQLDPNDDDWNLFIRDLLRRTSSGMWNFTSRRS